MCFGGWTLRDRYTVLTMISPDKRVQQPNQHVFADALLEPSIRRQRPIV